MPVNWELKMNQVMKGFEFQEELLFRERLENALSRNYIFLPLCLFLLSSWIRIKKILVFSVS